MREDAMPHETGIYTKKLIEEAPDKADDFIKVQSIL